MCLLKKPLDVEIAFWQCTFVGAPRVQGKKKKHINKLGGFSRNWVGGGNLFTCFLVTP